MYEKALPYKIYLSIEDDKGNTVTQEFTEPGRRPMQQGPSNLDNSILMSNFIKTINMLLTIHPTLAQHAPDES